MESCISEEQAQHGPIADTPSEEDAPPGEDEPMEDAPPGEVDESDQFDGSEAEGDLDLDYGPGKDASSEEDAPPRKVARSQKGAPPRKVSRSQKGAPPRKVARSQKGAPPRKVTRSQRGSPPGKVAHSQKGAPPGNDTSSEEDAPLGEVDESDQVDESEAEGDLVPEYMVESDHSSSCPDLYTDDEVDENNPEREWTSKSGKVWLPTNAETTHYVPTSKGSTPGPTRYATSRIDNLESSFNLFLTPEIINIIVKMTNRKGRKTKVPKWIDVDVTDVKAYIGLLILAGLYRSNKEPTASLWEDQTGRPIFRATMSYSKFTRISANLRFEDKNRAGRLGEDKLAPIRVIWDMWTKRLPLLFNPGEDVCVGEQLVPFRGQCEFRQYMPNHEGMCGMKTWVAADVATSYAWNCHVYTGKDMDDTGDFSQAERVVLKLTENLQRGTVTCDTVLTTYSLVQELIKRNVAMVGAIKKNKPELPPKLMLQREKAIYSSVFAFTKTTTAVSYVPKRGKNLVVLSSKHRDIAVSKDNKKKPVIVTDYNRCKGAVDNLDQAIRAHTCRKKVSQWSHILFCHMIDISAFNSFVIYSAVKPNWNSDKTNRRRLFLEELGKNLVSGEMMRRFHLPHGPSSAATTLLHGIKMLAAEAAPITNLPIDGSKKKRAWCWLCPTRKRKIDTSCIKCTKYTCKEHRVSCCWSCWMDGTIS